MKKIAIINGPNLNMLGLREVNQYGEKNLEEIKRETESLTSPELNLEWFQSNIEGELVTFIQEKCIDGTEAIVINPGGYSHTSVAIHDALMIFKGKIVEVHLSNTHKREEFRHTLLTARAADSIMIGLGSKAYSCAINFLLMNNH